MMGWMVAKPVSRVAVMPVFVLVIGGGRQEHTICQHKTAESYKHLNTTPQIETLSKKPTITQCVNVIS